MKAEAVRLVGPYELRVEERELVPGPDEVIVKTYQTSICDADLRAYQGLFMPGDLPSFEWIGHEGGGEVIEVGHGVSEIKPGDFVMCFGPNNAWSDHFMAHIDTVLPALPGMPEEFSCLGEPLAVGMFGVFQSGVQIGDDVAVFGLNYQGLLAVDGLKKKGAKRVFAVDDSDEHLEIAAQQGADICINTDREDPVASIKEETSGIGVDVTFHSCGYWNTNAEAYFNHCVEAVRHEGIFVSLPDMMSSINTSLHRFHHHAIDVRFPAIMHHNANFLRQWVPRVLRPVRDGIIDPTRLVTQTFSLADVEGAIKVFNEDPDQVKILLKP